MPINEKHGQAEDYWSALKIFTGIGTSRKQRAQNIGALLASAELKDIRIPTPIKGPVRLLMKRALFAVVFRTRSEAMMRSKRYNPSAFEIRRVFGETWM